MPKPVMLVILDGFGLAPEGPGNAVALADTPNFDRYWRDAPHTELQASGRAVGLPEGQMGNSEVGHMNLGAGRVVMQSLTHIQSRIDSGEFFGNAVLKDAYANAAEKGNALHLMGLVSRGGVHSDLNHLFALLELAKRDNVAPVYIHAFTDGRDTDPHSGLGYIGELQDKIDSLDHDIRIATVSGRYYAMDRDNRWDRVKLAYDAVVCGDAEYSATNARDAVRAAYDRDETDEFIRPTVIGADGARTEISDGDSVFFFNFRADRARQLTYALLGDQSWSEFERCRVADIHYASLMQYDEKLDTPYAFALPELHQCLAEVLSKADMTQYHTAETEKYPHVTYFFNAKIEQPFPGEERQIVPSPKVATYDLQPEMSAPELTDKTLARIRTADDDFILINYANPDMVGHTGVLEAAIEACEASDRGMGTLVDAVLEKGGAVIIIADHGNADVLRNEDGSPNTAHTTNPVPCVIVGAGELTLRTGGVLGDIAPTILELLGLDKPDVMTGQSLISR
ncbi:MAG: 2,3-bisphosphoglycerate-independent phosphoglycerate mutase [Trueperaceae bacterium]|nr:2,3-bisphosphoglycerate-independent phosphoglycerate mutase [Trueperaceae bacterium]